MSKQPVRVVAAVQPPRIPTVHVPPNTGRSYNEMVDVAERQRKQIETNKVEEERRTRTVGGDVRERLQQSKRHVAEGEMELSRIRELERETRALSLRNDENQRTLNGLQQQKENHELQLRRTCGRVFKLKQEIEEMQRRQALARSDAAQVSRVVQARVQNEAPKVVREDQHQTRPRASVEPFNVQVPSKQLPAEEVKKHISDRNVDADQQYNSHLVVCARSDDGCSTSSSSTVPSPPVPSREPAPSPSPPKDPHPSNAAPPIPPPPSVHDVALPMTSAKASLTVQMGSVHMPNGVAPGVVEALLQQPSTSSTTPSGDPMEEALRLRQSKADMVSLRPHSLQAAKRRSWAASESTVTESEGVMRALVDAQKRGVTHYAQESAISVTQTEIPPVDLASCPPIEEEETVGEVANETEVEPRSDGEAEEAEDEDEEKTPKLKVVLLPAKAGRSILRPRDMVKAKRPVRFDPLVLLLDAALEGEMDLVITCAGLLSDVSAANDEGITALHNAICAGHYEIVRFLIDRFADVNAQDSDGWTPLHCAASCNHLPMVRLLIESGACLFAATLSDQETPIEKCEEDEDGYDGCLKYMLSALNATGSINAGKVYGAYTYKAKFHDELSFEAGDELRVLAKDEEEKNWWRCEKVSPDGKKRVGICPRTYISLYPPIKFHERLNFAPFLIPVESNNNPDKN
ncbi:unnamed protein product, partial [Mesorhabditis spiculigera]